MNNNVPPQLERLVANILDKNENVFHRSNIRPVLVSIKDYIESAIQKFDAEYDKEFAKTNQRRK